LIERFFYRRIKIIQHKSRHMARSVLCSCHTYPIIMNILPISLELNPTDSAFMRRANRWAQKALERRNRPSGPVFVSGAGEVLMEAYCNTTETGDCIGHAETNVVRKLSHNISR